jgi:hypothetical protein
LSQGYPPAYGYGAYPPQPQTEGDAVAALVLAIVSWTVCPVICAVLALVLANRAEQTINASNGWRTGSGLVTAARVIAWINIGVFAVALVAGIIAIIVAVAASA